MGGIVYTQTIVDAIYIEHDAQLRAKDEEIERLKDNCGMPLYVDRRIR